MTTGDSSYKIEVCLSPLLYPVYEYEDNVVVIIDILRATSAICTALEYGAEKIIPVPTIEEAQKYKEQGYLVGAERDGSPVPGFDFGNSPFHYMTDKIKGKAVILTTTNGTLAIEAAKKAYKVVIGSFLNYSSLCRYLAEQKKNVLLLCAGWKNKYNLEDSLFAGAVTHELSKNSFFSHISDAALSVKYLYQAARKDPYKFLRNASHRKRFARLNLKDDIKYCLQIDKTGTIPVFENQAIIRMNFPAGVIPVNTIVNIPKSEN
ncbi:MAG: 2-phosphosulfolactate phosphatase [Bacteroidetes bacterium]|nr:2-phosphosulfolactate phosphatase [Bacteroidota bacterium]